MLFNLVRLCWHKYWVWLHTATIAQWHAGKHGKVCFMLSIIYCCGQDSLFFIAFFTLNRTCGTYQYVVFIVGSDCIDPLFVLLSLIHPQTYITYVSPWSNYSKVHFGLFIYGKLIFSWEKYQSLHLVTSSWSFGPCSMCMLMNMVWILNIFSTCDKCNFFLIFGLPSHPRGYPFAAVQTGIIGGI